MTDTSSPWVNGLESKISPQMVADIVQQTADLVVMIKHDGTVLDVAKNTSFGGRASVTKLKGQKIQSDLTIESVPKFDDRLAEFLRTGAAVRPVELNHVAKGDVQELPVRYSFHAGADQSSVMLIGHDLRAIAELQQQLVSAQIALEQDYEAQRDFEARLRVLMATAQDATLFVSATTQEILDCSPSVTRSGAGDHVRCQHSR